MLDDLRFLDNLLAHLITEAPEVHFLHDIKFLCSLLLDEQDFAQLASCELLDFFVFEIALLFALVAFFFHIII